MKITQAENEALIDALARVLYVPAYDPATMVTPEDLAVRMQTTKEVTEAQLVKLMRKGVLKRITVRKENGHKAVAYVQA